MTDTRLANRFPTDAEKTRRFVFVLLEDFTLLSFASAVECLRIANRMSGRTAYDWRLIGEDGGRVRCSAGAEYTLDGSLDELRREDTLVVCSGINVQAATTKKLLGWLRREARKGMMVGGLCTAAFTLAKAGLLDGKKATIHWENQDSFSEDFEDVILTKSVFVVAPLPSVSKPQPQALLHGTTSAKIPQPADANRYERDQCRTGLRLCVPVAFLKVLPCTL